MELEKFVNVFDSGPTVFKRLSATSPTPQIESSRSAIQLGEQIRWFIKLRDYGLIRLTPKLQSLIDHVETEKSMTQ